MRTTVTIAGNLTRDPRLNYTKKNKPVCNFTVAVNEWGKNSRDEWENLRTLYYDCTVWGDKAEATADQLAKGMRVLVAGKLELREYEYQGEQQKNLGIQVDEVAISIRYMREESSSQPQQWDAAPF